MTKKFVPDKTITHCALCKACVLLWAVVIHIVFTATEQRQY